MTEPTKKVHEGRVIPPAAKRAIGSVDALGALREIVDTARECFVIHETESSKRARLQAYERTEIEKIKAAESVLKHYFDQVFSERRDLYNGMFSRLDQAMESGQPEVVHTMLRGIVDVAQSSPMADLGDLSTIRRALDDPDQVWEL